ELPRLPGPGGLNRAATGHDRGQSPAVWRRQLTGSEVAAAGLLALEGLEQRLEVALAEPFRAVPLDQLEEHRGPVLHRLGEDLQQVAVLVAVHEDLPLLQLLDRRPYIPDAR